MSSHQHHEIEPILNELKQLRGMDFSGYRRPTLERRISMRMARLGISEVAAYIDYLRFDPAECTQLIDTIAINVSSFFRDSIVFELIARRVLPKIFACKQKARSRDIRLWSAGCASGEEAYSLAMLVHLQMEGEEEAWSPLVFATDIDSTALDEARKGVYSRDKLENAKLGLLDSCFELVDGKYAVKDFLKTMVHFSVHDLLSPESFAPSESVFGTFDLVLLRNVLIYFLPDGQRRVLAQICRTLGDDGYLVLGSTEYLSAELESCFNVIDKAARIFQRRM